MARRARLKAPPSLVTPAQGGAGLLPPPARGRSWHWLYDWRWTKASKAFIARNPYCIGCRAAGRTELTALTDHVVPHKGDRALFWNAEGWQPSCRWHHDVVKQALEHMYEAGLIGAESLRLDSPVALGKARKLRR